MRTQTFRRTPLFTALACAFISPAALAVVDPLQVTSAADDGGVTLGTLAYAINFANSNCSTNQSPVITFAIPGTGPFVISSSTALPQFYCPSTNAYNPTVDGSTQSGFVPNSSGGFNSQIMIQLDGSAGFSSCGLSLANNGYGGNLTVRGLDIHNFTYGGFSTGVCGAVNLYGNHIVGNSTGVSAQGGSTIGTGNAFDRNVISGNAGNGVTIAGGTYSIVNNLIGVDDVAGIVAAPNSNGVQWNGCCSQAFGAISYNTIVSVNTGVDLQYDGQMTISGNVFGGDPSASTLMTYGGYGISMYYSYGASIDGNIFMGQDTGIYNYQGQNVSITGNRIGVDASGTTAVSGFDGIYEQYSYGTSIDGNLISGHEDSGIYLSAATYVSVTDNLIGTDASGTSALGNYWGVYLGQSGAAFDTFDGNTISGNNVGIYFRDASSSTVSNNRIGTNPNGTAAVPNNYGVWAECGVALDFSGNTIGGNTNAGMQLSAIQDSTISANQIGGLVPNGGAGLELSYLYCGGALDLAPGRARAKARAGANSITLNAINESDRNQVADNVISNNSGHGLWIMGGNNNTVFDNHVSSNTGDGVRLEQHFDVYGGVLSAAVGNSLALLRSHGNSGKNVNLGFDGGPRPNDSMDADGGPDNGQNKPVIPAGGVVRDPGKNNTTVTYSLDSKAGDYVIYFYANPTLSTTNPAGETYVGNTTINLPADGVMGGTYTFPGTTLDNISAIATRTGPETPSGDSSEYADEAAATTLAVAAVSVVPNPLDFGDVVVGRSQGPSPITLSSVGTGDYILNSLRDASCTGPAICSTGSFICSTSCVEGNHYAPPTGNCSISVTFAPTALGPQTKTLALCDNTPAGSSTITFTGNGIPTPVVDIAIAPSTWSFGEVLVGNTSGPHTFTVSNLSASQVYLGGAHTTGDFNVLGASCGATLAGNSTCSIDAVFAPLSRGGVNGTLEIIGSDAPVAASRATRTNATTPTTNTVIARLQGSGVQTGDLRLPSVLGFGSLLLHSAPATQNLQITNSGNGTLTINNIAVSGPFTMTNGCGATLAPGASCTVTLGFNPATLGSFSGTLTIVSDASGGSRAIALSASVVADARPVVRVNATTLGFGQRIIGSDSPAQRLIISNEGAKEAALSGITFTQPESGGRTEYSLGGTSCGATLAAQATCTADIVFKALGFGARTGEVQVQSNSSDSPARVQVNGTGCRPLTADIIRTGRDPCAP